MYNDNMIQWALKSLLTWGQGMVILQCLGYFQGVVFIHYEFLKFYHTAFKIYKVLNYLLVEYVGIVILLHVG